MNEQASRLIQLRQLEQKGKSLGPSNIVSVCSGKGGTGKTFVAANLAYALSKFGKKILLVDLDINFANVNILLNQTTSNTISEFFEQRKSLKELIQNYSINLDVIYGDSGKEDYPRVSEEIIDYLFLSLKSLNSYYDYIILDSSGGGSQITLHQLQKSDVNIFITSTEPTAVMDAYVVLKLLNSSGFKTENLIVVNKCLEEEEGDSTFQKLLLAAKHFLGEEPQFLGSIPFNLEVHQSIINQQLLAEHNPNSLLASKIKKLATSFISFEQVVNNNQTRKTS